MLRAMQLYVKDMGLVWVILTGLGFILGIWTAAAPNRFIPEWFWLLVALGLIVGRGIWLYRDREINAGFGFKSTSLSLLNPKQIRVDDVLVYSTTCKIGIEIENKQPNQLYLKYDLKVVDTDLPPRSIQNDDIKFHSQKGRKGRETGNDIPMQVGPNEQITDGVLTTTLDIVIDPLEEMIPILGKANKLAVEVIAWQSEDAYVSSIVDGSAGIDEFTERLENDWINFIRGKNPSWQDYLHRLKLLWKGRA